MRRLLTLIILLMTPGLAIGPAPVPVPSSTTLSTGIDWPRIRLVPTGFTFIRPTHIGHAGDGSSRLYIVEQAGRVHVVDAGNPQPQLFLDISAQVSCCGERGLLSIAFPPDFGERRYFYVNYTDQTGATVIARYHLDDGKSTADSQRAEIILRIPQPYRNHNGGQLAFGPDGYLYIGMGDGGSSGDPGNRAQSLDSLFGKILRIDVESGSALPYTIPATNPFTRTAAAQPEIWALGLRNPWRFSFDRETGDLFLADVGQNSYEEISFQSHLSRGGENYGWRLMEGSHCYLPSECDPTGLVPPIFEYSHSLGCAVTGGHIYRGSQWPQLDGIYFLADYCSGNLWGLRPTDQGWQALILIQTPYRITTFGEDEAGEIYLADLNSGAIYQLQAWHHHYLPSLLRVTPRADTTGAIPFRMKTPAQVSSPTSYPEK